ncbi:MAG: TolC family protein [Fimbriiglobus sp.]|nr:TolC family protein [Fimbriiglobus sp.]
MDRRRSWGGRGCAATPPAAPSGTHRPVAQSGITPPPDTLFTASRPPAKPAADPADAVYPITLSAALKLAGSRPLDIAVADRQVALAAQQFDRARLAWVPNLVVGADYFRHDGGQQNFVGDIIRSGRSSYMVGAGPNAVVSITDAVFGPLAAKQDLKARTAFRQAVENDTALAVVEAYFNTQQARGELAGAVLAADKARDVAAKAEKLAEGLVPPLEASRAKVELARREQAVATARERWRTASAELVRLLRLQPGLLVEPVEEPYLPVTVIDPNATTETLLPVALATRPELAAQRAMAQANAERLKQEKARPFLPTLAVRSVSTNPSGSLGWGGFGGGPNDTTQAFGSRFDVSAQLLWEFQAFGLANRVRVGERRTEQQLAVLEVARMQDRVTAEVSVAFAQARAAGERLAKAEPALREAVSLVEESLKGMGQTKRTGDTNTLLVRPLEVVAAVQALALANADFYAAVADYNRGQFRLYRALGHPADVLSGAIEGRIAAAAPSAPSVAPSVPPAHVVPPTPPAVVAPPAVPPTDAPPTHLPPIGSAAPTDRLIHATARVIAPPPLPVAVVPTRWQDLPIGREVVLRRSAVGMADPRTEPGTLPPVSGEPLRFEASPSEPPKPKTEPVAEVLNWSKAKEK